ncbi:hypothetical protein B296_00025445 [Ensete ventricosum]|uniref:UspA domain-containing protein n=1 Tax=Ensete ventricosum TaxID=4639 RepID=A0A427AT20_ENSVE|nr:hypothetical protein B296_00025445 [Ensete ventricosum]
METVIEDVAEYSWREVVLPALIPLVQEPVELDRETGERRRGRDIVVAVDHGPNSRHALHWALVHLCRLADTLHFVHAVSSTTTLYLLSSLLSYFFSSPESVQNLDRRAERGGVRSQARIVEGDAGKVICREAERLKPAAVVMGTRGRNLMQRSWRSVRALIGDNYSKIAGIYNSS